MGGVTPAPVPALELGELLPAAARAVVVPPESGCWRTSFPQGATSKRCLRQHRGKKLTTGRGSGRASALVGLGVGLLGVEAEQVLPDGVDLGLEGLAVGCVVDEV